ncbi:hypothetical protein OIU83_04700 [Flavobacterium sp. LS1R49]|uniref:Uncharacterized protein n=1 Tax=Flavobacterium shii TaxID=2987687 RepID=A0A9X3BX99_9FLAO|nr:hypothetical protein [Flavobacterium shii]MCV9926935.1 hypothetical protein [Flavobacterium shii]
MEMILDVNKIQNTQINEIGFVSYGDINFVRSIKLLIAIFFLSFISCKHDNNQIVNHSTSTIVNKTNNDTLVIKGEPIVIFLSPSNEEIEIIKREKGDDNFFTIADDENSYRANIDEILKKEKYKTEITEKRFIKFIGSDKVLDKSDIDNKWAVLICVKGKPTIISSVDLFVTLNKLKENHIKIDYNSILERANDNLLKSEEKKISLVQNNDLSGLWRIDCGNALTTFDITDSKAYISIYSNTVYINAQINDIPNEPNNYLIRFLNQEDNNEGSVNKIDEKNISKEKSIGKLEFKNNKLKLYWYGLYNEKTKKLEYDKNTPFDIEGENIKPVTLIKCD